uniref:Relaxin-like protein AGF n=1 Tax=Hypanus sabinus TaxID=79690 RepID=RELX_HYPSI|nr:RecName: Full=Relaxin-like protein AGF; Contains: RecName: Full=Relaxin-like protein AGF B chain; Contains: RecName: Full=Relaxin-like protein AGF A chain [Hypanus sabinus]
WPRGPDYTERRVMCGLQYVRAAISICGPNMQTMRPRNGSGPIVPPPDFLAMYGMARYKPPLSKKCCSTGCNREDFRGYCYL